MATAVTHAQAAPPSSPEWERFFAQVRKTVFEHPVVTSNTYCDWFERGTATREQVRDLCQQFSVFSNLFIVAQLLKTINAPTLEQARESKEILANELGVIFHGGRTSPIKDKPVDDEAIDRMGDPELVSTEGTVDGGTFKFSAAHFEWLLQFAKPLDLDFDHLGKRKYGTPSTLFFCDELSRLYGSEDADIGEGASFAVEHWAAAGFWKQLIKGLDAYRDRECPELRLAFFTWHDRVEDQHAAHTMAELIDAYRRPGFDEEKFLHGAREMLDGVKVFWDGLDVSRRRLAMDAQGTASRG
jgi:hypothetical protein